MRFLRHLGKLLGELFAFAWQRKAWWLIPVAVVMLLLALLVFAGQTIAPFIYTLF